MFFEKMTGSIRVTSAVWGYVSGDLALAERALALQPARAQKALSSKPRKPQIPDIVPKMPLDAEILNPKSLTLKP